MIYSTMLVLIVIIALSLGFYGEEKEENYLATSGSYERVISTDKEIYELGEQVEAAIVFINPNEHPISINPINYYSFSGNSVYDPEQISGGIHADYPAGSKIVIPAEGNLTFTSCSFTPTYPGPFKITGLGHTKTVNVTGYKEANVNSTGISLKIEPNVPAIKDHETVEVSLILVNDNPYPVKIPVFSEIRRSLVSTNPKSGMLIQHVVSHYEIEAYSKRLLWRENCRVSYPGFSIYYKVEGVMVALEMEVIP
jgi:hypothetical protein